ncbi:MAG: hypothetical protein ACXQTP_02570 [Candidatus Methanofastidiosia archaeon]
MSVIEDVVLRNLFIESKNLLELDIFTSSSFGRSHVKSEADIEDIRDVVVPELIGLNVLEQKIIDAIIKDVIDDNKMRFAFSLACAKAAASYLGLPLYQYLGGIFNVKVPQVIFGGSVVDTEFKVVSKPKNFIYQKLDTITGLSYQNKSSCIKYVEDGSWHIACGLSFDYVEIYRKEDINELLRIKEHMLEV